MSKLNLKLHTMITLCKRKVVPTLHTFLPDTRWVRRVFSFKHQPLYSHGTSHWYLLDKRLGGPQEMWHKVVWIYEHTFLFLGISHSKKNYESFTNIHSYILHTLNNSIYSGKMLFVIFSPKFRNKRLNKYIIHQLQIIHHPTSQAAKMLSFHK
jgi:hypothetical protein